MIDTNELRKLCTSATPGPWYISAPSEQAVWYDIKDRRYLIADTSSGFTDDGNAEFIAAANPATVLALLDALDDAHRNMDDFGLLADKKTSECRSLINWVNDIAEDLSIPEDSVDSVSMGNAIFRLKQIEAAARNLVKVKGSRHAEIAYQKLVEVLG